MAEETYILCVYWGEQHVASIQVLCSKCSCRLALSAKNEKAASSMKPICMRCASKEEDVNFCGCLMGGKNYEDLGEACAAALDELIERYDKN